jgi:hypothetical protein
LTRYVTRGLLAALVLISCSAESGSTTSSLSESGLSGYAAQALADGFVSVDELHEAQQLTVDCLRTRGLEAEYQDDMSLRVVQPQDWTQEDLDHAVDECQENAGGPVVGAFLAQEGPSEGDIRDELLACLQDKGLVGPDPTPDELDAALDTPDGFSCIPGVDPDSG